MIYDRFVSRKGFGSLPKLLIISSWTDADVSKLFFFLKGRGGRVYVEVLHSNFFVFISNILSHGGL